MGGFDVVKTHKEFSYVYKKGKNQHSFSVVLFYLPQSGVHKVGFTATKKLGNAVKRNRAKRRMRAMFCEYSDSLHSGIYIFVAKAGIFDISHESFKKDFQKVIHRAKAIA